MTKRMLIDAAHAGETRVAIVEDDYIIDYDFTTTAKTQVKGNIYLAKITRVEPSLQAAFVEFGNGKQGFLPFAEIHPDYYQLPQEDKQKLLAEQIAEAEAEEAAEDEAFEREQAARERGNRGSRRSYEADEPGEEEPADALDGEENSADQPDAVGAAIVTPPEVAAGDSMPSEPALDVAPVEIANTFAPDEPIAYNVEPLVAESYHTASDVVDATPEESNVVDISEAKNAEEGVAEEGQTSETASEDAEETRSRNTRNSGDTRSIHRRYRIQEVIKRNQIVLVQVIKEERGNKGCSLTSYISLAGRCAVLMPNSPKGGGISRKITDRETRKRLKEVAGEMRTHRGMSVIIRTAGIDRTKAEIRRDYEYLVKLWNQVRENTLAATAPALIYEEGNLIKRALRDQYSSDIEEVMIDGKEAFEEAKSFMTMLMPSQAAHIKIYKDSLPLFAASGVEDQLSGMQDPQVRLPSGGYIVIHITEALIAIDVNSGRSTSERNVEETALKTNIEAAWEVGRQLRLRDLAGLIVVDFIDMNYGKNRKAVERAMKDALKSDRAKIQLGRISMFGLMELSRQRMRPSMSEAMGVACPHCRGTGFIHSVETVAIQIIRTLENQAATGEYVTLRVTTHPEAALHLLNEKRALLQSLEERYNVTVVVLMDTSIITGHSRLIKVNKEGKESLHEDSKQPKRARSRRGGTGRSARQRGRDGESTNDETTSDETTSDSTAENGEPREPRGDRGGRNRNRRGGRDRNNNRNRSDRPAGDAEAALTAEGAQAPAEGDAVPANGEARPPRGDGERSGRRRGRRGGKNRNRNERGDRPDRTPREPGEVAAQVASSDAAPAPYQPSVDAPAYQPAPVQPKPAFVIPLSEAQTNPPVRAHIDSDPSKPKKKGWFSRVMEN
jgi:ribonuclease E